MSAATPTVLILAAVSYLLKATGPLFLGGRQLPAAVATVAYKIPGPLLAALVLTSAVTDGPTFVFDARIVGLLAAIVALRFRACFVLVVVISAAATAATRFILG